MNNTKILLTQELMNRIVFVVGQQHNSHNKLNAGEIREYVKLILEAFAIEILGGTHKPITEEQQMPAKKKGAVKKTKPMPKPKAK